MSNRTILEQEFYEQFRDQGMDEYSAAEMAREWAVDSGEYDGPPIGEWEQTAADQLPPRGSERA